MWTISNELLEPTIRDIAIFFDILCKNIEKEFLAKFKDHWINFFQNLFLTLIELVFDNKLVKLIEDSNLSSKHIIIHFITNPSNYIYLSIKEIIYNNYLKVIPNIKEINNNFDSFISSLFLNYFKNIFIVLFKKKE